MKTGVCLRIPSSWNVDRGNKRVFPPATKLQNKTQTNHLRKPQTFFNKCSLSIYRKLKTVLASPSPAWQHLLRKPSPVPSTSINNPVATTAIKATFAEHGKCSLFLSILIYKKRLHPTDLHQLTDLKGEIRRLRVSKQMEQSTVGMEVDGKCGLKL